MYNERIEQIEARKAEIKELINTPGADFNVDKLTEEVRSLNAEAEKIKADEAKLTQLRGAVDPEVIETISARKATDTAKNEAELYRRAFLKNLAVRNDGEKVFGEMSKEERAAFTHTTANSGNVVPPVMMNRIIDLVESMSPMLDDATPSNMTQGFGVPRRKSIEQGDATSVAEGTANDDEENEFDLLSLDGCEIKKHIVITRKMKFKSIDAFEDWVVKEISERISVAKEGVIIARLDGNAPAGGSAISGSGIDSGNILTAQTYDDATIRSIMGKLRGVGQRVVYASSNTIWNYLFGIEGTDGKKLFIPNSTDDPIIAGRIYGALVKEDENLADNVVYFGVKGKVLANDYEDFFLHNAIEAKTVNNIITGYSLFDAGLENPKSFVKATFTPGP